ncbi:ParE family toxin-like protein [Serratia marcescens]|uniref:ParE family toxin-like protein n=1 Tax=Serratia marcescens TaxID=615 RepID=UPI001927625F|nr:hypothetical protein [Serratia marcescens]
MTTIKRFTPDYKMHAVRFEAFAREAEHGEYVRFDAHQQKVSALEAEGVLCAYREGKKKPNRTYQHKHLTLPVARCWRLLSKDNGNSWEVMSHERYNNQIRI